MMSKLPEYVRPAPDRHGKMRYRFRRKGWKSAYVHGEPGTPEFHNSLAAILAGGPLKQEGAASPRRVAPRSLDDLFAKMKATTRWRGQSPTTTRVYGRMVERFLDRIDRRGRRYGERPVETVTVVWLEKILSEMAETPAAANNLRKILKRLMAHAVKLGWRSDNPADWTDTFKEGPGYHTWTEEEIAQYREHHALGTMARLVLELALNTAARRCNVATLTRDSIKDGRIIVEHVKGCEATSVPMLATTRAALEALPAQPIRHLVTTQFGKPFTVPGLGNRMRKWCDEAGLKQCSMHGLRKALSRRVAEAGGTDAEGQAITGHKKAATFVKYREKANRMALADRALSNLAEVFDAQPIKNEGNTGV